MGVIGRGEHQTLARSLNVAPSVSMCLQFRSSVLFTFWMLRIVGPYLGMTIKAQWYAVFVGVIAIFIFGDNMHQPTVYGMEGAITSALQNGKKPSLYLN